ncbi:hypothetical protein ACRC7T_17490 (plasmid) [Segnochrobactraceae bacterium EtOH-i3]
MSKFYMHIATLAATFMVLLLTACLPDGAGQNDAARREKTTIGAARSTYVGEALTHYALRSQHVMTTAPEWSAGTYPEGGIAMGRVDMGSASAVASSAFCRDRAGRGYHLTWTKRPDDGGGVNVAALSRRVASDTIGLVSAPGVLSLQNGKTIKLSAACLSSSTVEMPANAAVIAMALSLPTNADLAGKTKVMFETAACSRARQTGYELVKVVARYDKAGRMQAGYPKRSVVSAACTEQRPTDAQLTASTSQILSNSGGFGASGIARLLSGALGEAVPCAMTRQVEITGYDDKDKPQKKSITGMDSCNSTSVSTDLIETYGDTDLDGDRWEMNDERGYCRGGTGSSNYSLFDTRGIWSWPDWEGEYTSKRWVDKMLTTTSDGKKVDAKVTRGPWIGSDIDCSRQEKFRADCADISAVRALGKPYASNQMWVNVDIMNDTGRHFDVDWIGNLFGSTIGCWFGCDKLVALDVDIMNKDYFDGLEVSGELHMKRPARITKWDNAAAFTPHVPRESEKDPWAFDSARSTCAVSVRTPLFTCKGSSEVRATVNPRSVAASNVLRHDILAKLYSYPRTSDGAVMTTLDPDIDKKYLIIGGKYPSGYSIKKLHWAVKSCSIKGCDTDHQEKIVYRVYIDRDRAGYQKVLDQGFYYTNKKVIYDQADGFYMTDKSIEPSANDATRCEVIRLEGRKINNLSYTVRNSVPDSEGKGGVIYHYEDRHIKTEFMETIISNYVARTEGVGYTTEKVSKNVCVLADGSVKYCTSDPYAGSDYVSCEEVGMYPAQDCVLYSSGGDDTSCRKWKSYCSGTKQEGGFSGWD